MHYRQHHLKDYWADAAHLTLQEHGALLLLTDFYFKTEAPIPDDIEAVCRRLIIRSKSDRTTVESVLNEFFDLRDDGWHRDEFDQKLGIESGFDTEIAEDWPDDVDRQQETQKPTTKTKPREKDRANASRQQEYRNRRAKKIEALCGLGVDVPKNISASDLDRLYKQSVTEGDRNDPLRVTGESNVTQPLRNVTQSDATVTQNVTQSVTNNASNAVTPRAPERTHADPRVIASITQDPLPKTHNPKQHATAEASYTVTESNGVTPRVVDGDSVTHGSGTECNVAAPENAGAIAVSLRASGVPVTPENPILRAWIKDGITLSELHAGVEIARSSGKPAPQNIPPAYLDKIVRGQRETTVTSRQNAQDVTGTGNGANFLSRQGARTAKNFDAAREMIFGKKSEGGTDGRE